MNDLFFARSQMGMSLAFHIIFAVIGMAMPLLMAVSEAGAVVLLPSLFYLFQIFERQEQR
jgi:cytochrome bd-type quinol oxidase subunit 1